METLAQILINYGGFGMFLAAFLAGSFLPFCSEIVMLGLLAAGVDPMILLLWGTIGNVFGGLFNYAIGSLGKEEWISRWSKVEPQKLEKGKRWVKCYGAWAGLLAWVPILGSIITVAMGYLRVNIFYSVIAIAIGKCTRYWLLIRAYLAV